VIVLVFSLLVVLSLAVIAWSIAFALFPHKFVDLGIKLSSWIGRRFYRLIGVKEEEVEPSSFLYFWVKHPFLLWALRIYFGLFALLWVFLIFVFYSALF